MTTWEKDIRDLGKDFFQTANTELPILEGIDLPITIIHVTHLCILMINFIAVQKHEKFNMAIGADDLQ